jgi:hypothetical protein
MISRVRSALAGFAALAALTLAPFAPAQSNRVDLELVLAIDSSNSVDEKEYALQMQGFASAFTHPSVLDALRSYNTNGIAVTLVQWAGAKSHEQVIGWTLIRTPQDAAAFAQKLLEAPRAVTGPTAPGDAITFAAGLIEFNAWDGKRRVIDVSGDGRPNEGEAPPYARARALKLGMVINGLVILNEEPDLERYYRYGIVGGKGAFLEVAKDFESFEEAIRRKLRQEISGVPIS